MKNPFSYRNGLASYLKWQRKAIDAWITEETKDELYQELQSKRVSSKYLAAEKRQLPRRNENILKGKEERKAAFENFKKELSEWPEKISYLNEEMAEELISYCWSKKEREMDLYLNSLKELTPEAAKIIVNYDKMISLPRSALKNNPKTLKNLMCHKYCISFFGVGTLDEEMIKECEGTRTILAFHDVSSIAPAAAKSLVECGNLVVISIEGNPDLTPALEILASKNKILLSPEKFEEQLQYIKRSSHSKM